MAKPSIQMEVGDVYDAIPFERLWHTDGDIGPPHFTLEAAYAVAIEIEHPPSRHQHGGGKQETLAGHAKAHGPSCQFDCQKAQAGEQEQNKGKEPEYQCGKSHRLSADYRGNIVQVRRGRARAVPVSSPHPWQAEGEDPPWHSRQRCSHRPASPGHWVGWRMVRQSTCWHPA